MTPNERLCPRYQKAAQLLGKRWTSLILKVLMPGPQHFSAIADQLEAISDRVLSERLKELIAEDIVYRTVYAESPVRIEYSLTEKGQALDPLIIAIEQWSQQWLPLPDGETECSPVAEMESLSTTPEHSACSRLIEEAIICSSIATETQEQCENRMEEM